MLQSQKKLTSQSDNGGAQGTDKSIWQSRDDQAVLDSVFLGAMLAPGELNKTIETKPITSNLFFLFGSTFKKGYLILKVFCFVFRPLLQRQRLVYLRNETSYLGV